MSRHLKLLGAALVAATLAACGGGGGSGSSGGGSSNAGTAQGWWQGTTNTGYNSAFIVLENQETWGINYRGNTIYGAFNGTSNGSGTSFTSTDSFFNFSTRTTSNATFSGNVTSGQSATLTDSVSGTTFNGSYNTAYDAPASLANITGSFTGWGLTKSTSASSVIVTINSAGAVSANIPNCTVSGTVTPRASGKGVFNVSTTFVGSGCAVGNGVSTTGIAVLDTSSGTNRLIALTLNSGKTDGFIFSGQATGGPGAATSVPAQQAMGVWLQNASLYKFNAQYTTSGFTCLGTYTYDKSSSLNQAENFDSYSNVPYSTVTATGHWSNCTPKDTMTVAKDYYTSGWTAPLGFNYISGTTSTNQNYGVYAAIPTIPTTLRVGDTGSLGTINLWTNSTKATPAGRRVVTYSATQESTSTILLTLAFVDYDTSSVRRYTETDVFRVNTDGVATLLSITINYPNGNVLQFM